jgi:NhaP-type Na+/H+ or K+/H+ antiporter
MSFREKLAWVSLLSTVVIWSSYFGHTLGRSDVGVGSVFGSFVAAVVLQAIMGIIAAVTISVTSRREPKDERDSAVDAMALKIAYYVLLTSGFVTIGFIAYRAMVEVTNPDPAGPAILLLAQLILLCLVVAEATRFLTQVICYRRGA